MPEFLPAQHFNDIGTLGSEIGWDLDFRQLDTGSFTGRASVVATPQASLMRVELSRSFHQRGFAIPGTLTYGLVDPGSAQVRWHGADADGRLLDFNHGAGFDGISTAGMCGLTFGLAETVLTATAGKLGLEPASQIPQEGRLWDDESRLSGLRQRLAGEYSKHADVGGRPDAQADRELEQLLATEILLLMNHGRVTMVPEGWRQHMRIRDRAIGFIEQRIDDAITVADVCEAVGVSWATLDRVFRRHVGQSPKRYIRSLRLQRVRQELLQDRASRPIADIANRWGFWHLGQFARDYRKQFQELPSDTARLRDRSARPIKLARQGPGSDPQ